MVIAKYTNFDIDDNIEIILHYRGRCIVSTQTIIASENIANSLLQELSLKGIEPISVYRSSSSSIKANVQDKADKILLDYLEGHVFDDIVEFRNSLHDMYEMKKSAYQKATNLDSVFSLSSKIAGYIKFYECTKNNEDFDESTWDFDSSECKLTSTSSTSNVTPPSTYCNEHDNHHITRIPIFSPYLNLIYSEPLFGQVYWVDFGEPFGAEIPYIRPAIVIQTTSKNTSSVLVVPTTSKLDTNINLQINPIVKISDQIISTSSLYASKVIQKSSQILFSKMRSVDKSRLRQYLYRIDYKFLAPIVEEAISALIFSKNTGKFFAGQKTTNIFSNKSTIPIDTDKLSTTQKQILEITKHTAYIKLRDSNLPEGQRITNFLIEAYGFDRNNYSLKLLLDSILFTIHETQDFCFNLTEYAQKKQTKTLKYDSIIKNITSIVRGVFYKYPRLKVSEFISLVAKITGGI